MLITWKSLGNSLKRVNSRRLAREMMKNLPMKSVHVPNDSEKSNLRELISTRRKLTRNSLPRSVIRSYFGHKNVNTLNGVFCR